MKKSFLSLVALVIATISYAQSSMLATLSHEGEISTFYGALALRDAYNAAQSGDVITLSSGLFSSVDIEKAVTIRGAGMGIDATAQSEPTVLAGDFTINIPEEDTNRLTIEGIFHNSTIMLGNFKNGSFLKDKFKSLSSVNNGSSYPNLTLIHCKVSESWNINPNSPISCVNSIIFNPDNSSSSIEFVNCVIKCSRRYPFNEFSNCSFKNCILDNSSAISEAFNSTNIVYNCVASGNALFNNISNTTNVYKTLEEVFKTYTGIYNDDENFVLTDEIKESIKGIDGTEVGIYGGNLPFSTTPTNPQITKCNVAAKSTADGKLSVDITVNGAE